MKRLVRGETDERGDARGVVDHDLRRGTAGERGPGARRAAVGRCLPARSGDALDGQEPLGQVAAPAQEQRPLPLHDIEHRDRVGTEARPERVAHVAAKAHSPLMRRNDARRLGRRTMNEQGKKERRGYHAIPLQIMGVWVWRDKREQINHE